MVRARWVALVACLLVVVFPTAAAQILVEPEIDLGELEAGQGRVVSVPVENPTGRTYVLVADVTGDGRTEGRVTPSRARLGPESVLDLTLTVEAPREAGSGPRTLTLQLRVVDTTSGDSQDHESRVHVVVTAPPLLFGLVEVRLPDPFDTGWGLVAFEAAVWVGVAAALWIAPKLAGPRLPPRIRERRILGHAATLVALLVLALGLRASLRHVTGQTGVVILERGASLLAIVLGALLVHRALANLLGKYTHAKRPVDEQDPTDVVLPLLDKAVAVAVTAFALAFSLQALGVDVSFLLAGGVVVGLVLSLAAQDTLSNLFSGFFILLDRPFREGDEIRLDSGEVCRVDRIGLRSTRLYHFRHEQQMIVPNNDLATRRVTNLSYPDTTYRLTLRVDVAQKTDLARASEIMVQVARATPDVMGGPGRTPVVWLRQFTESGIETQLRVYIPSSRHRNPVRTALIQGIQEAFRAEGIRIPAPQLDLRLRSRDDPGDDDTVLE